MDVEPGTIVGEKYRLERPLSRGGMGAVWVARHIQLGAPVALKFMDPDHAASPEFRARFYREARTAANLGSPHIVNVQDYGIQGTVPFLVMELLRGEDLGRRLRRVRRISLADAARLVAQTGKALRRAHDAGLVHRDLKPGNLFLARIDDEEVIKVLDFGIAKQIGGRLTGDTTKTGELLGSPFYMSPEQARGDKDLDSRSDLWSLAVILFRAVTGKLPFDGDVLGAVLSKILVEPVPKATEIAPDLPEALNDFFERALARDRTQRFQTAAELARAFIAASGEAAIPGASFSTEQSAPSIPSVPAAHSPTLPGISPSPSVPDVPTATERMPGELFSWPEEDDEPWSAAQDEEEHPLERARRVTDFPVELPPPEPLSEPAPEPEPSQPGTLTSAAGVRYESVRLPKPMAQRRWMLLIAALFVASGAVAIAAFGSIGAASRAASPVAQERSAAPPTPTATIAAAAPAQPAPPAAAPAGSGPAGMAPDASAPASASAQADAPRSPPKAMPTGLRPMWRKTSNHASELVDPWRGR